MEVVILILIIDHFDSFSHNLYQAFADFKDEVIVRRCDELTLEDIKKIQARLVVLSPGPRGPRDTGITLSYLNSDFAKTQATLGICLGLQAMGVHWGLDIQLTKEVVHGKTCLLKELGHPIFKNLASPLQVARYHSLCIPADIKNDELNLLAEHENMVMAIEDLHKPWIGLQFHPESFLTPEGKSLLLNILDYTQSKE